MQYPKTKACVCIRENIDARHYVPSARNREEQGFTAAEFKSAQKCGWEKQYQYKVGRKKMYMTPSEADAIGYERVSKYPKSTKYGRQNPITERWSSDEQLIKWREAWADATNKILAEKDIDERIDHRSFKERGITEQPTIHEGVTARIMEKQWNVSERCELNRQIRADNRLLRRLKTELQKITMIYISMHCVVIWCFKKCSQQKLKNLLIN